MFRWVSLLFSWMATGGFVVTLLVIAAGNGSPASRMAAFNSDLSNGLFLGAAGLTVLLLIIHLLVAATQRAWGWLTALLVWPPLCFIGGAAIAGHWYRTLDGGLTLTTFYLLGGLVNLVFGIVVFKPWQAGPKAIPSAEAPTS